MAKKLLSLTGVTIVISTGPNYALEANNTVSANGTINVTAGELPCAVFAAVLEEEWTLQEVINEVPNPYDEDVPDFVEGTPTQVNGVWTWSLTDIPTARGNCLLDTLVVWALCEDSADFLVTRGDCRAGDNCGSGSGNEAVEKADAAGTVPTPSAKQQTPAKLTGTISSQKGTGSTLPNALGFVYSQQSRSWEASLGGASEPLRLRCQGTSWDDFTLSGANGIASATLLSGHGVPFELVFDVTTPPALGKGSFKLTITE